jgi:mannose-6-phosphate isomerase-like protein (cupin superfamily)
MTATAARGYFVRHMADAESVPCPCGVSTRPLPAAAGAPCSLHVTTIADSERHYHRRTAEVYHILDGTGKMELNGDWVDVRPGTTVWIEPGTRHRLVGDAGRPVRTIVFGVPAFDPADEFFD